jgi:hypothetical protein
MLLSLPICKAWARYLPNISFFGIPLNPGPFTIKEHVIITIMAAVGSSPAYAVSVAPIWQIISGLLCSVRTLTISFRRRSSSFRKSFTISIPHLPVSFRASSAHLFGLLIDFYQRQNRPVAIGHVIPTDWLFDWWNFQALRCHTAIYDLA